MVFASSYAASSKPSLLRGCCRLTRALGVLEHDMTSNRQKRIQLKQARIRREQKKYLLERGAQKKEVSAGTAPCNSNLLAPNHSFSDPAFVLRGYYCDLLFKCKDCGTEEVWTATRQKWWYEVAKGDVWTTAVRCNACRRKERERRNKARQVQLEGLSGKGMQHA